MAPKPCLLRPPRGQQGPWDMCRHAHCRVSFADLSQSPFSMWGLRRDRTLTQQMNVPPRFRMSAHALKTQGHPLQGPATGRARFSFRGVIEGVAHSTFNFLLRFDSGDMFDCPVSPSVIPRKPTNPGPYSDGDLPAKRNEFTSQVVSFLTPLTPQNPEALVSREV